MDKATELAKIIAWAQPHGVTPELRVWTRTTTTEGYGPSPDEKGIRGSAWHRAVVEAVAPAQIRGLYQATAATPYLSEEGREERLARLRPLLPSPFEVVS